MEKTLADEPIAPPGLPTSSPVYIRGMMVETARVLERIAETFDEIAEERASTPDVVAPLGSPVYEFHVEMPWDFTPTARHPVGRPAFGSPAASEEGGDLLLPLDLSTFAPAGARREEQAARIAQLIRDGLGEQLARWSMFVSISHATIELEGDRPEWHGLVTDTDSEGRRVLLREDLHRWLDSHVSDPVIRAKAVDCIVGGYFVGFGHSAPDDLPVGIGEPLVEMLDAEIPPLPRPIAKADGKTVLAAVQFGPCVLDGAAGRASFSVWASALVFDEDRETLTDGPSRLPTVGELPGVAAAVRELAKKYAPEGATIFGLTPPAAPVPVSRRPTVLLDVRARMDPETVKLASFAVQGSLPRSWRKARRWEEAERERIEEILGEHGEAAFTKTDERPALLARKKGKTVLSTHSANRLEVALGTRGGFIRLDDDGEWLVRALQVGRGFVTVSLSWYHSAEQLISERREAWAKDIRSRLESAGSQRRLAFDELSDDEKAKIERVLDHIGTLEDARILLDAVLRRAFATGARLVDIPARELRVLLRCDNPDGRGNERIRRGLAALEHLSFKVEHRALKGAASGRFQGRFVSWHGYYAGGAGAHSDGVFVVGLADPVPGVAVLLDHSVRGKKTLGRELASEALTSTGRSPATPASIELLAGGKIDDSPRLRQKRRKGDRPARALSTAGPWRKVALCETVHHERAFEFLEGNLTTSLAADTLGRPKRQRKAAGNPEGLRLYDRSWCPLLPDGEWVAALGTHRRSPETGWKLAGKETFATKTGGRKPAGLIDQVGRPYPPGSAHVERRREALATLDDFAFVVGRLGGVLAGVRTTPTDWKAPSSWDWVSLEAARGLSAKELIGVRWYPFLPADWARRADEIVEAKQDESVARGEAERPVFVTRNPSDYLAAAEADGIRWQHRPGDVEDLETWPEDGRAARAPKVRPLGERLAERIAETGAKKGEIAKAFGVSPASLSRWLRPLEARDEHKGSGVPTALEGLVERWIEGGPLPTAEELEAVSSRRGKARESRV
jgi:transposase-like protein